MADVSSGNDLRYLPSSSPSKRSSPNVSSGWVVMLLSGLVAAVLFLYATQQSSEKFAVAVLTQSISPGQPITAGALRQAEVNMDQAQLDRVVRFENRNQIEGWIATGPMEPGDLLLRSNLREPATSNGLRSMSIPVDKTHAVGGDLRAGDRVDIVDANLATAAYVARDIQVLSVNNDGGGLGSSEEFSLTLAVDSDQAVKISQTIKGGKFDVIRSTGAGGFGT